MTLALIDQKGIREGIDDTILYGFIPWTIKLSGILSTWYWGGSFEYIPVYLELPKLESRRISSKLWQFCSRWFNNKLSAWWGGCWWGGIGEKGGAVWCWLLNGLEYCPNVHTMVIPRLCRYSLVRLERTTSVIWLLEKRSAYSLEILMGKPVEVKVSHWGWF